MRIKPLVSTIAIVSLATPTTSTAQVETKCESRYVIYYGNGINNSPADIDASIKTLAAQMGTRFNNVPISYSAAANPTEGVLFDLYRVFAQKLSENPNLSWEVLMRVSLGLVNALPTALVELASRLIRSVAAESGASLKKQWQDNYAYVDSRVKDHVIRYTRDITENGRRVLLVAHSQGNLYANASHRQLYTNPEITPGSFGTIGIATPANFVAGGGSYLTSDADAVIKALNILVTDNVLPTNISIPFSSDEPSGHNFIKTYMHPEKPAREKIRQMTGVALNKLVEPKEAYDYKIVSNIISSAHWYGSNGNDTQIFDPSACPPDLPFCPHPKELKNIFTSAGTGLDRQIPTEKEDFRKIVDEIVRRLSPIDSNAANPDHPLNWHINATIPLLWLVGGVEYDGLDSIRVWGSSSYDAAGNIFSPPIQMGDYLVPISGFLFPSPPPPRWMSRNPVKPAEVFAKQLWSPLIASLDGLRFKAIAYEVATLDYSSVPSLPQTPFYENSRITRLTTKVCKPDDLVRNL